jgi:predicted Zn-dependent protease
VPDSVQDFDSADKRERLSKLEAQADQSPDVARRIAKLKSDLGDAQGAHDTLSEALLRFPTDAALIEDAARLRLAADDAAGALSLLAPLETEAKPNAAILLARARAKLGDVSAAAQTLAKAIARFPKNLPLVEQCARYRLTLHDTSAALEILTPFEADAKPNLALLLARARAEEGDVQAAIATLQHVRERHPDDERLVAQLATYLLNVGDAKGAATMLASLEKTLSASTLLILSQATADAGDIAESEAIIDRAIMRHPGDPILIGHLAQMHLNAGRSREAVALLAGIEDSIPAAQAMLLSKARLFTGDPMEAMATLERAVQRFPKNAMLLLNLATARRTAGDANGALAALDQTPEPRGAKWYLARSRLFEMLGDIPASEATIRQGLAALPDDVSLLSHLSRFLSSQERHDEAHATGAVIEDALVGKPEELGNFITSYFIFGDAHGAAELIARILSKLEAAPHNRKTTDALMHLIPGARLLRSDIGAPLFKRILAQLSAPGVRMTLEQHIWTAVLCGIVEDYPSLRARIAAMMPKLERAKDIIEVVSLAAWTHDLPAVAALEDRFKTAIKSEQSVAASRNDPVGDFRIFCDRELGATGFDIGGSDVVILFQGLYNTLETIQQTLILGSLARKTDVIRLYDMRRDVLLSGIGPETTGREQAYAALKRLIAERGYRRVICVGLSGGGMPAAVYGDAIGADRVVVFSTGTFFPPDDDGVERRARAFLHKVRSTGFEIGSDNLEIWKQPGPHPEFHLYYPALNPQDARHALRMEGLPGVTLHPAETAEHGFFTMFTSEQFMTAIFGPP